MEKIKIYRSKTALKQQFSFLIKREFIVTYSKYWNPLYYLSGLTIAVLALYFFTNNNSFITLKAVSIMIVFVLWVLGIAFSASIFIKWIRRKNWRDKSIDEFLKRDMKTFLSFDNDKLYFITDNYKSEANWEYYKYYGEDDASIYFFPEKNIYEAVYFSSKDIGEENFIHLKTIAQSKLISIG